MLFCAIKFINMFVFPDEVRPIIKAFLGWDKQKTLFVIVLNFLPIISSKLIIIYIYNILKCIYDRKFVC